MSDKIGVRRDALLHDFLEHEAEARAKGITLEAVYDAQVRLANHFVGAVQRTDRVVTRLKAVENELARRSVVDAGPDWKPDRSEITGTHQVKDLLEWKKEEEHRRRDSETFWQRQRWIWIVGVATVLLGAVTAGCVGYVNYVVQQHPPAARP